MPTISSASEGRRQGLRPQTGRTRAGALFLAGNLTALRELALRRTAERVDEQLLTHMQAISYRRDLGWRATRLLVCVSEDPRAAGLVRYTRRMAMKPAGPVTAMIIRRGQRSLTDSPAAYRVGQQPPRSATTSCAQARRSRSTTDLDDVLRSRNANNVTQIIIGKSARSGAVSIDARFRRARSGTGVPAILVSTSLPAMRKALRSRRCRPRRGRNRSIRGPMRWRCCSLRSDLASPC